MKPTSTDKPGKPEKTILNRKKWYNRKIGAIMTAMALATAPLFLTGCDPAPSSNTTDSSYTEKADSPENVPEDIAQLDDSSKAGTLVQGRDACIDKLVTNGLSKDEATKVCDDITKDAQANLQAQQATAQPVAQGTNQPTTVIVQNNNGASNALFWYWLGSNNRPYIYYGSPSSGLTMFHSTHYSSYHSTGSGSSGGTAAKLPPEHLTSNQSTFLATEHAMRPAVTQQLASRPGVKVISVPHFTHDGVHTTAHFNSTHVTSTPHTTTSHVTVSHGGLGGHGVSTGG